MDPGTIIAQRFRVERRVSTGGMSAVFLAGDLLTGIPVAVKVLYGRDASEHVERLHREARILARLRHAGIVHFVADGEEHGQPYLAMEWIPGETLSTRLARAGLTMDESVRLVMGIAEALSVAHGAGVVHRDVKPGNVVLRDGNVDQPVLIDFGIARMGQAASEITHTGVMLGTLGYMAPEQARGVQQLDARADVFALGAVLFKCVTGMPAFAGEDEITILAKVLFEAPPRARDLRKDVPAPLDDLIGRMLARDPRERPADAGVVAAELAALGPLDTAAAVASRSAHVDVLTRGEQRLVSVIALAADAENDEERTLNDGEWGKVMPSLSDALRAAVKPFGARLHALASGSLVVTLPGRHSATDQATRAARCVLAMRTTAPLVPMALATGRAVLGEGPPVGEAIGRAVRMLPMPPPSSSATALRRAPIVVDEVTAGLLDARFSLRSEGGRLELTGEKASIDAGRMLLGKPTPCVGRARELVRLESVFAECVADEVARAVLVTAPAGVGKSRLRYEVLRMIQHRSDPHEVWTSRGDPMRAGSPFGMLAQLVRAAAEAQDGEPARVQREKIRARVGRYVPQADSARVTHFLAEMLGVSVFEEEDVQVRAARHDSVLMGDQMRRAFEDWLRAECTAKPVVLVLEDLHWGDLPSVHFVDSALRAVHDRPLMVLALARPEVKEIFTDLFAERGVQELQLKELSSKASEKLVREVLGDGTSDELVGQIVQTSAGNAFFLEELIRACALERAGAHVQARLDERRSGKVALPETVLTMVQARLEGIEPEARRVLRAASIFGQTFWRGGVVALLAGEESDAQVAAWLDELCEREIVSRREATKFRGEQEYVFRHAFLAEAAYGMLTDKDRAAGHRLAALWLEKMGESEAVVLAEHLERGGEPKRAITFYRRAAAQALEGNDLAACLARADRGIACGAEGEVLGRLLLRKAEAHRWRAENVPAKECSEKALALLPVGGARWFAAAGEAVEACARLGDESGLHHVVDELCDANSEERASGPHLVALTRAACVLMQAGNYPSADDLLRSIDAAFDVASEEGIDPLAAAHVYRTRAYRAQVAGDAAAALTLFNAAVTNFEEAGDVRAACRHVVNASAACIELGAYAEAERALGDAQKAAERMGLSGVLASVWHHTSMLRARTGDLASATRFADAAVEAFVAQGDRRMEAAARLYRVTYRVALGDLIAAERDVRACLEAPATTPPIKAFAYAVAARVQLDIGRTEGARRSALEAIALLEELGGIEEGESYARLTCAEVLHAAGDRPRAAEVLGSAKLRLVERAAMITDEAWRTSFLETVRENARTFELSRSWGSS